MNAPIIFVYFKKSHNDNKVCEICAKSRAALCERCPLKMWRLRRNYKPSWPARFFYSSLQPAGVKTTIYTKQTGAPDFDLPVLPLHLFRVIDECFDIIETAYPSVGTVVGTGVGIGCSGSVKVAGSGVVYSVIPN